MELPLFLHFKMLRQLFIEVALHSFPFPSPSLPGMLGLLVKARFSGNLSKGDYKLHLSLIINIKIKLAFLVFLLNGETALS